MNKKLYFYSTCLAIVYTIFVCHCFYEVFEISKAGYNLGVNDAKSGKKLDHYEMLASKLVPTLGAITFPSVLKNEKTGEEMRVEIKETFVYLTQIPPQQPWYMKSYKAITLLLTFILIGIFVYLPLKTFKVMKSISKNEFYSMKNIKNIRKIAIALLVMFFLTFLSNLFSSISANFCMQIKGYNVSLIYDFNYAFLSLGLVLLILAEILRFTTTIKEEQDLTV